MDNNEVGQNNVLEMSEKEACLRYEWVKYGVFAVGFVSMWIAINNFTSIPEYKSKDGKVTKKALDLIHAIIGGGITAFGSCLIGASKPWIDILTSGESSNNRRRISAIVGLPWVAVFSVAFTEAVGLTEIVKNNCLTNARGESRGERQCELFGQKVFTIGAVIFCGLHLIHYIKNILLTGIEVVEVIFKPLKYCKRKPIQVTPQENLPLDTNICINNVESNIIDENLPINLDIESANRSR